MALAFSGPNVEEEFQSLKEDAYDHEFGVEAKKLAVIKDGISPSVQIKFV